MSGSSKSLLCCRAFMTHEVCHKARRAAEPRRVGPERHLQEFGNHRGLSDHDKYVARRALMEWMYEQPHLVFLQPSTSSSTAQASGSAGERTATRSRSPRRVVLKPASKCLASSSSQASSPSQIAARQAGAAKAKRKPRACGREGEAQPRTPPALQPPPRACGSVGDEPLVPTPPQDAPLLHATGSVGEQLPPLGPTPPLHPPAPAAAAPPPPPALGAHGRDLEGWCDSCGKWRRECFRRWDWACPTCANHNYAKRQQCVRCGQARYCGQVIQLGRSGELDMSLVCSSHGCPRYACFKPFDWLCSCGNHNFASKRVPRCNCLDVWVFRSLLLCCLGREFAALGCLWV